MSKVFCQNCGAEVILPEHSTMSMGISLSEKDTSGTYIMPTKSNNNVKENKNMNKAQARVEALKRAGIDTSNYMVVGDYLFEARNGIPYPVDLNATEENDKVVDRIMDTGYIFNRFTNARWIPAQMMHAINSEDGYEEWLNLKGYNYQFNFMRDEINRLEKLEKDSDLYFRERGMFFTPKAISEILADYLFMLKKWIGHKKPDKCKGVEYVRIPGFKYGNDSKGDVFVVDLDKKLYRPIENIIRQISYCNNYTQVRNYYGKFMRNYYIALDFKGKKQSKKFRDAFKGLGAYCTIDNLVKFHGCRIDGLGTYDSLKELNAKAVEYVSMGERWRLFSLMHKVIEDNNFTIDWN